MRNPVVALGLGSNLGHPIENLRNALTEIKKSFLFKVLNVASIYESEALLPTVAIPDWNKKYLNSVVLVELKQTVDPVEILNEIKKIELQMGRKPAEKWAPRKIDIDVLYWNAGHYQSEKLNIPHSALLDRPFALLPLLEVWPELKSELAPQLPSWANGYTESKPFNTIISQSRFWPRMVGILNVTQDSFSDGGQFLSSENLSAQLKKLLRDGVDILDVGAESTRPGAKFVEPEIEFKNLSWALNEIKKTTDELGTKIKISIDSRKAWVVERVIENYEVDYLNDVSGFSDPKMQQILKKSDLPAFVMHSVVVPPEPNINLPEKSDPFSLLTYWWEEKIHQLKQLGVAEDKLIFDMGIGFGKSKIQSLYLLQNLEKFSEVKNEIMVGHSRKSFQTLFSDRPASERDTETALITQKLNLAYTQYLRVHDVKIQKVALLTKAAI